MLAEQDLEETDGRDLVWTVAIPATAWRRAPCGQDVLESD